MAPVFLECNKTHNQRIIDALIDRVLSKTIAERRALDIAKSEWKPKSGAFTLLDQSELNELWANALAKQLQVA